MCKAYAADFPLETRMARYHNVYGPRGTWKVGNLRIQHTYIHTHHAIHLHGLFTGEVGYCCVRSRVGWDFAGRGGSACLFECPEAPMSERALYFSGCYASSPLTRRLVRVADSTCNSYVRAWESLLGLRVKVREKNLRCVWFLFPALSEELLKYRLYCKYCVRSYQLRKTG